MLYYGLAGRSAYVGLHGGVFAQSHQKSRCTSDSDSYNFRPLEENEFTVGANPQPSLIVDYNGFLKHTYQLTYPTPGAP